MESHTPAAIDLVYSVMARMRAAISTAVGSGLIDCSAISLAMSRLRVALHQDGLGHVVVQGDLEVHRIDVAGVEDQFAAAGVDVGLHRALAEGNRADDQVHPDRVRDVRALAVELGPDGPRLGQPFVAQKLIGGHRCRAPCRLVGSSGRPH
jgi:hypothetical protein